MVISFSASSVSTSSQIAPGSPQGVDTEGESLDKDEVFGSVEAVKTVSDLFLPVSGEVLEFNEGLEDAPESVNEDPYGKGWMVKMKVSDPSELDGLMDAAAYEAMLG